MIEPHENEPRALLEGVIRSWTDRPSHGQYANVVTMVAEFSTGRKMEVSTADIAPYGDVPDAIAHINTVAERLPDAPRFNVTVLDHRNYNQSDAHVAAIDRDCAPIQYVAHAMMPDRLAADANAIGESIIDLFKNDGSIAGAHAAINGLMVAGMSSVVKDSYHRSGINPILQTPYSHCPIIWGKRTVCGEDADFVHSFAGLLYDAARNLRTNVRPYMDVSMPSIGMLMQFIGERLESRQRDSKVGRLNPFILIAPRHLELPVFAIDNAKTRDAYERLGFRPGAVYVIPPTDWISSKIPVSGQYDTLMLLHRMYPTTFLRPEFLTSAQQRL